MISFWKRIFSHDVLPNNRYLMNYAVAHRKHNDCGHDIIYIQECMTLVEGLLVWHLWSWRCHLFFLCRCATLKLGIVSIYLRGSVQYSCLWERTGVRTHINTIWACCWRSLSMCGREEEGLPSKHSSAGGIRGWLRLIGWGTLVCSQALGEFVDGSVWEVSRSKNTSIKDNVFHFKRETCSLSHFGHLWLLT